MGLTVLGKNIAIQAITDDLTFLSLHSGSPGETGENELPTGVYSRQPVEFGSAVDGAIDLLAPVEFATPDEVGVIKFIGLWSGDNFMGVADNMLPTEQPYSYSTVFIVKNAIFKVV